MAYFFFISILQLLHFGLNALAKFLSKRLTVQWYLLNFFYNPSAKTYISKGNAFFLSFCFLFSLSEYIYILPYIS